MSNREMCIQLMNTLPDFKLGYVLAYLQGLTAGQTENEPINEETRLALEEAAEMKAHPDRYPRYQSFDALMAEVLNDA